MKHIYLTIVCGLLFLTYSCGDVLDSIQPYLDKGETIYVGKLDSIKAYPGKNRVKIEGLMLYGINQMKCVIQWKSPQTSEEQIREFSVERKVVGENYIIMLNDMEEGQHDFFITTHDDAGNSSIRAEVSAYIYGERYEETLENRSIRNLVPSQIVDEEGVYNWATRIDWNYSIGDGIVGCNIEYETTDGSIKKRFIPVEEQVTILTETKSKGKLTYTTTYLPDTLSIDTFYTITKEIQLPEHSYVGINADLTEVYIKNAGNPFRRSDSYDHTWGVLRDWSFTPNILNQNEDRGGGYANFDGGVVQFETRNWSGPGYTNGKLYQTFTLPPGKYNALIYLQEGSGDKHTVNFAVAQGTELPDNENITQAIAYNKIVHSDGHRTERSLPFELSEATTITIGWVVTLNEPQQYIRFRYVKLMSVAE